MISYVAKTWSAKRGEGLRQKERCFRGETRSTEKNLGKREASHRTGRVEEDQLQKQQSAKNFAKKTKVPKIRGPFYKKEGGAKIEAHKEHQKITMTNQE